MRFLVYGLLLWAITVSLIWLIVLTAGTRWPAFGVAVLCVAVIFGWDAGVKARRRALYVIRTTERTWKRAA